MVTQSLIFMSMVFEFSCDIGHIRNDVPHQLWEAITADGNANTLLTRFLHNTPSFYANDLLRCYLSFFSPDFLNQAFTFLGLLLFGFGLWYLITHKKWRILIVVVLVPLLPLFDLPSSGFAQVAILYSLWLLVMVFGLKNLWQFFF